MQILLNILATVGLTATGVTSAALQTESIINSEEILHLHDEGNSDFVYNKETPEFNATFTKWNFSSGGINTIEELREEYSFITPGDFDGNAKTPSFYFENEDVNSVIEVEKMDIISTDEIIDGLEINSIESFAENATWSSSYDIPNTDNDYIQFGYVISTYWDDELEGFILQATFGFDGNIETDVEFNYGFAMGEALRFFS